MTLSDASISGETFSLAEQRQVQSVHIFTFIGEKRQEETNLAPGDETHQATDPYPS